MLFLHFFLNLLPLFQEKQLYLQSVSKEAQDILKQRSVMLDLLMET